MGSSCAREAASYHRQPRVVLRPTIPSDLPKIIGESLPHRIHSITAEVDGKVIGIGGLAFQPDGHVVAFVQLGPEARRYPVALHRAALITMARARELGLTRVLAFADPAIEPSERWLTRLGFHLEEVTGARVFVWNAGEK
jgi:N-acetylglutamate synthase-like GNAT family acetyltransferase